MSYTSIFLTSSFAYMLLFAFSYGNLILSSVKERTIKIFVYFLCFAFPFILILFSGLRWECGTDWNSYKEVFDLVIDGAKKIDSHFDKGYVILNRVAAIFSDSYTSFLLLDSFVAVGLVVIGLKRVRCINIIIALHIFFTNYFCGIYMGSNRRIIAIGLCLNALISFTEKKYWSYLLFQILAFFFHRTSLIFVLILFIPKSSFSYKKIYLFIFLAIIIGFFKPFVQFIKITCQIGQNLTGQSIFAVGSYYITYQIENKSFVSFLFAVLKRVIFILIFLHYIKKYDLFCDRIFVFFFNVYLFALVFYFLMNGAAVFLNLTTYFTFSEIIIWGYVFSNIKANDKKSIIFLLLFFGIFQMYNNFTNYTEVYLPYKSIISKI